MVAIMRVMLGKYRERTARVMDSRESAPGMVLGGRRGGVGRGGAGRGGAGEAEAVEAEAAGRRWWGRLWCCWWCWWCWWLVVMVVIVMTMLAIAVIAVPLSFGCYYLFQSLTSPISPSLKTPHSQLRTESLIRFPKPSSHPLPAFFLWCIYIS